MEETMVKENKMGVLPVDKLLVTMSLPMMISMLVQALYNIVDSIFVARIEEKALTMPCCQDFWGKRNLRRQIPWQKTVFFWQ